MDSMSCPKVVRKGDYFYQYEMFDGDVLSKCMDISKYLEILDRMQNAMWSRRADMLDREKNEAILSFYKVKTEERLESFVKSREYTDKSDFINGIETPSVSRLLANINWGKLAAESKFALFHGDFHSENIVFNSSNNKYCLIDWRHEFHHSLLHGDVYYDLAKFMHGLIVNHSVVTHDDFYVKSSFEGLINISSSLLLNSVQRVFCFVVEKNEYSVDYVNLLTALIFINISPLHHRGYDLFLMQLGRYLLNKEQVANNQFMEHL